MRVVSTLQNNGGESHSPALLLSVAAESQQSRPSKWDFSHISAQDPRVQRINDGQTTPEWRGRSLGVDQWWNEIGKFFDHIIMILPSSSPALDSTGDGRAKQHPRNLGGTRAGAFCSLPHCAKPANPRLIYRAAVTKKRGFESFPSFLRYLRFSFFPRGYLICSLEL